MKPKKTIFVMRHGQTFLNARHCFSGQKEVRLTPKGKKQAGHIGKWFAQNNILFDRVYASPMGRANQTARIVALHTKFDTEKIRFDKRLIEQHFGQWEGKTRVQIQKQFPHAVDDWMSDYWSVTPKGGENYVALEKRLAPLVKKLKTVNASNMLVVCHANVVRVLVKQLAGLSRQKAQKIWVGHTGVYRISFTSNSVRWKLIEVN